MKYRDKTWNAVNNLLTLLNTSKAVELVTKDCARFGNNSLPKLLKDEIDGLQQQLNKVTPKNES